MNRKPTYEELFERIKELEQEAFERHYAEEELQKSKAMLKAIFESLPFDVFALDPNNRYFLQNPICKKNWGDLIGKCPEDLPVNKETLNLWANNNRRAFAGETVADEVEYHSLEGKKYFYHNIIAPIRDEEKIFGILGVLVDISEFKQTEKALMESEERYRSLFKNNHSVMLLIDPESGNIVDANPAAVSFYGWSYEDLTRKKIADINTLTEEQVFGEMEKAKMEQRKHFYFRHRLASGKIRDVEVYSGPINVHGRDLLYSIVHDITDRKQAEKALRKAHDELEHRVKERTKELEIKTNSLEEVNMAMKVLLKKREEDKTEIEDNVLTNVKELIAPYFKKINKTKLDDQQKTFFSIIESNLNEIISPFTRKMSLKYLNLTPAEILIANLIRHGSPSKEIAELLNVSPRTIDTHRKNIRRKIGLQGQRGNLRSHLLSLH